MELRRNERVPIKQKGFRLCSSKFIICALTLLLLPVLFRIQASPFDSWDGLKKWKGLTAYSNHFQDCSKDFDDLATKLRDSTTFLPPKDLRYAETPMTGNTWFMSSLNDTYEEEDEAEHLFFPSQASKGRLLCVMGHNTRDGTKNSYALAWPGSLPDSAIYMRGLSFVSDTYYDYGNLWHSITAMAPFVGWSMKHGYSKPTRWVLFHWGELRDEMGSWIQHLMQAYYGEVEVEGFGSGDGPYCFEKALVMRHNMGRMRKERKLEVCDLLRCKAREFCGINPAGKGMEVNERGEPIIRLTLLMRRGSRSFKNATAVTNIFAKECERTNGCILNVVRSEDLRFCDQTLLHPPHGAQLTNMLFMDRGSSVMEFFPKGWLELAGVGQYAHHWMADLSGMIHRGSWWEQLGEKECPHPENNLDCFLLYKNGQVGHNETFFAEWARAVLNQVRLTKLEHHSQSSENNRTTCACQGP